MNIYICEYAILDWQYYIDIYYYDYIYMQVCTYIFVRLHSESRIYDGVSPIMHIEKT